MERRSRLVLAEVDRAMLDDWVARAKDRAGEYSISGFDDACPEEWIDEYVAVNEVMNTAPREDLDMEDEHWTAERLREHDQRAARRGDHRWTLLARHDPTGYVAGYTEIDWSSYMNDLVWQGGTAVDPAHRDKGLGRWLKAAMLLAAARRAPGGPLRRHVERRKQRADAGDQCHAGVQAREVLQRLADFDGCVAGSGSEAGLTPAVRLLAVIGLLTPGPGFGLLRALRHESTTLV